MLSILIPVYNFNVTELVHELHKQIINNHVLAEIIVVDDASESDDIENQQISQLSLVKYECLTKNLGRSAIRNYLASIANYDFLLFLDCDAQVVNSNFIINYINAIDSKTEVICGGLCYHDFPPANEKYYLRWIYGVKREARDVQTRIIKPYRSFSSFNFLIKANVFNQLKFDELITGYGHEDTFFGVELEKRQINLVHTHNPLLHEGFDELDIFLHKTELSIKNLITQLHKNEDTKKLIQEIKILRYVYLLKKLQLGFIVKVFIQLFRKRIINNLKSPKPSLFCFDLYKLDLFLKSK